MAFTSAPTIYKWWSHWEEEREEERNRLLVIDGEEVTVIPQCAEGEILELCPPEVAVDIETSGFSFDGWRELVERAGHQPQPAQGDYYAVHPATLRQYEQLMREDARFVGGVGGGGINTNLTYRGTPLVLDPQMQTNTFYYHTWTAATTAAGVDGEEETE